MYFDVLPRHTQKSVPDQHPCWWDKPEPTREASRAVSPP
jgi:hypothetical protein